MGNHVMIIIFISGAVKILSLINEGHISLCTWDSYRAQYAASIVLHGVWRDELERTCLTRRTWVSEWAHLMVLFLWLDWSGSPKAVCLNKGAEQWWEAGHSREVKRSWRDQQSQEQVLPLPIAAGPCGSLSRSEPPPDMNWYQRSSHCYVQAFHPACDFRWSLTVWLIYPHCFDFSYSFNVEVLLGQDWSSWQK